MTERPILFSGEMVRALLREIDPKTQTRRVVKPQPPEIAGLYFRHCGHSLWAGYMPPGEPADITEIRCPYGAPGDRLWVRETWTWLDWCHQGSYSYVPPGKPTYPPHFVAPDGGRRTVQFRADYSEKTAWGLTGEPTWIPSIHMPRCASRITLEVTEVRVERVQDISHADALAEGIQVLVDKETWHPLITIAGVKYPMCHYLENPKAPKLDDILRAEYASLWDTINAKNGFGWKINPWVWVIGFKRIVP